MRLPEKVSTWQLIVSIAALASSMVILLIAEAKNKQAEAALEKVEQSLRRCINE